ncbi:helix-turn-helix transcriptional regulator [Vibrio hannami]|uniref:helix-turn-helix transcriptional regulator n=1 Tax=Vibrio hannami TaxID=2717094 RepID=UPI00241005E8|nr:response regulator transcription factor [Vibrio hannami]MDG3085902.1 helix-turn-helix transcriptional regulator [Vibrio hannami]
MAINEGFSWEVSLIGLSLTAFTLANIHSKSYKHKTDWLLTIWLIILCIPLVHTALTHFDSLSNSFFLFTNPTLNLLHGPVLYLYVRMLISKVPLKFGKYELWHFIPFLVMYLLFITLPHPEQMMPQPDQSHVPAGPLTTGSVSDVLVPLLKHFGVINVLVFIGYSLITINKVRLHKQEIKKLLSRDDNQVTLSWIYALPMVFLALVTFNVLYESILKSYFYVNPITLHLVSFLSFILLLCFFGIRQTPVFKPSSVQIDVIGTDKHANEIALTEENTDTEPESNEEKIAFDQIVKRMNQHMENEKPYLDPDFTVYVLADNLNIPRRNLSLVLSKGLNKNFYQYVNEFRIEEVKIQLADQNNKSTILDIAFQAGFKSKSSFNSLFKQYCDVTPSQYRKTYSSGLKMQDSKLHQKR